MRAMHAGKRQQRLKQLPIANVFFQSISFYCDKLYIIRHVVVERSSSSQARLDQSEDSAEMALIIYPDCTGTKRCNGQIYTTISNGEGN